MGDVSTTETGFKLTIYEAPTGVKGSEVKKEGQSCTYERLATFSNENDPKKDKEYTETYTECYVGGYKEITKKTKVTSVGSTSDGTNDYGEKTKKIAYTATITTTETDYKIDETKKATVTKDGSDSVTLGTQTTTMQLYYLAFNRQVYKPNEIIADVCLINTGITSGNLEKLLGRIVKIERYSKNESQSEATTEETFSGFYIHDFLPLKEENMYPYVRLHIYSFDHQLTLKKYSRTYTGQQLFADILLEGYKSDITDYQKGSFHYNMIASTGQSLYFPTYYKQKTNASNATTKDFTLTTFDHLAQKVSFTVNNANTPVSHTIERIQPYLVQYNESFYDFMVRTANRCGEFFFWEDNALRLGRTCTGAGSLPTNKSLDTTISDSECKTIFYSAFDSQNSYKTEFFASDPLNDLTKIPELNSSNIGSAIKDVSANTGFYYNEENNLNVYRTRLYKGKFDSVKKEKVVNDARYGISFLSRVLNSTSIFDIIKKIVVYEPLSTIIASIKYAFTNAIGNDLHIKQDQRPHKEVRMLKHKHDSSKNDDPDYYYCSSFETADPAGHIDSTFYSDIRKNEEILTQKLITFNLKEAKRFRLGQVITYDSTDYVIIQIKINLNDNASKFSAIDPEGDATFSDMKAGVAMQVVAIPKSSSGTVYPPLHPAGHVRHSEPQTAIVSDFKDPQQRGRVRIIYPWQHNGDTEASPWIRVLTPSATPGTGCTFPLAVGDEVLVNYESNNIERPYVVGSLFNRTNFASADMTIMSKNGHGISFSNPADYSKFLEGIFPVYGLLKKLFIPPFETDFNDNLKLAGGIKLSDYYGFYKIDMSTDQRKIDISSPFGKVNIDAFTGITISAPNGDITIKGQNVNIEAGNAIKMTSGTNVRDKSYLGVNLDGGWKRALVDGSLKSVGALADGAMEFLRPDIEVVDLDLLRKIAETFLRPIDGTMQIKSYRYMFLEAGPGDATIQSDRYKATKAPQDDENTLVLLGLVGAIEKIDEKVDAYARGIILRQNRLNDLTRRYASRKAGINAGKLKDSCPADAEVILTEVYHTGTPTRKIYKLSDIKADSVQNGDGDYQNISNLHNLINSIAAAAIDYYNYVNQGGSYNRNPFDKDHMGAAPTTEKGKYYADLAVTATNALNVIKIADFQNHAADGNLLNTTSKNIKEAWFKALITQLSTDVNFPFVAKGNGDWAKYVGGLSYKFITKADANKIAQEGFAKGYVDAIDWCKNLKDFNHWEAGKPGQIILSDQATQSFYFKQDGSAEIYQNKTTKEKKVILDRLQQVLYGWTK